MYKGIVNKIKYNKFLRNLTLSLGYKFPNLINWKKQLKNTHQFKDIKKINKKNIKNLFSLIFIYKK